MTTMTSSQTDSFAIDLTNIAKTYKGKVHALRGVSMQVGKGDIFGLLGPNGAGKSTLIKILMTIVKPTKCQGRLLGSPVGNTATLAKVGYLPEHLRFPDYLTGQQTLDYLAALAKVPRKTRQKRATEMLELVGMTNWAGKKVVGYSKGMKQRLGVAQALMNDPDLVLLDEPTDGVDPVGRRDIRNILLEMKSRGKTIFINSHLLGEIEMVCDRVSILVQGQVAMQGTLDELTQGGRRYEIQIDSSAAASLDPAKLFAEIAQPIADESKQTGIWKGKLKSGESIELEGSTLRLGTIDASPIQPIIDALRKNNVVIGAIRPIRPSLEDLFIEAVTDPETGQAKNVGAVRKKRSKGGRH
jgi:ABC-2 type transport system ATP-binding protein